MAERVKKILLVIIFIFLLLPLMQGYFPVIKSQPLYGVFDLAPNVRFSLKKWMDGSYQEGKSKHLNDYINFRPDLIRLNCQIDYSLFRKLNTGWGVLGKNNCLFDGIYIDARNGTDFVGYDTLQSKMVKLKELQDTLARSGKQLVLVYAPSKAYYYENCIPENMIPARPMPTNYGACLRLGDSLGINQLDFNAWFCAIRDTSKELLYPKQGIHWSFYGALLAGDSLTRYMEHLRKTPLTHLKWDNIIHTKKPRFTDNDIASSMNLIWPLASETFTYADLVCNKNDTNRKPSAIYIGDSFTWTLIDNDIFDCTNSKWEFWFYFKERHTCMGLPRRPLSMNNYDWPDVINKTDYIVLIYTPHNVNKLGSGFIEAAYKHYFPGR